MGMPLLPFVCMLLAYIGVSFKRLSKFVSHHAVRHSIAYPKTSTLKALKDKPLFSVDCTETSEEEAIRLIGENIDLNVLGLHRETEPIVKCLFANRDEFFLNQIDNVVISKMGMTVRLPHCALLALPFQFSPPSPLSSYSHDLAFAN